VPSSGDLTGSFLVGGGSFPLQSPYLPADLSSTTVSVSATFTTSGLGMGFAWCDYNTLCTRTLPLILFRSLSPSVWVSLPCCSVFMGCDVISCPYIW